MKVMVENPKFHNDMYNEILKHISDEDLKPLCMMKEFYSVCNETFWEQRFKLKYPKERKLKHTWKESYYYLKPYVFTLTEDVFDKLEGDYDQFFLSINGTPWKENIIASEKDWTENFKNEVEIQLPTMIQNSVQSGEDPFRIVATLSSFSEILSHIPQYITTSLKKGYIAPFYLKE